MAILYAFEAQSIQAFIFATGKLREMVGASEIVEELCQGLLDRSLRALTPDKHEILYQAAGGARIQFHDDASADTFMRYWPLIVSRHAPGLGLVQAKAPASDPDALQKLVDELRVQRSFTKPELPETTPPMQTNPRTGQAAEARERGEALEPALVLKRKAAARANNRMTGVIAPEHND